MPTPRAPSRVIPLLFAFATALQAACGSQGVDEPPIEESRPAPASIDEAVERRFADAGLEPILADDTELCRRLFADLVGRFPTPDEVTSSCAGRPARDIAADLQGREEYVVLGLRRWRDRIGASDRLLYWRDLMPLFDLIERHLRQEIDYEQFAIEATSEPGLMALDPDPEGRAYRVHRVFLGTEATPALARDLARLTRIWDARITTIPTFSAAVQEARRAYVVPGHCGELGECATDLIPGGTISFPDPGSRPFGGIRYELLSDEQRQSLQGLGHHLATQPTFWEAAADEVLDRLLGWNDGGTEPRKVGRVLPEVRQLVLEHLVQTKSIASAERLVIGSLLYRQSHRAPPPSMEDEPGQDADETGPTDRPIWAQGPLKFTPAEVLLDTLRGSSLREGTCDPRTADDDIYDKYLLGYFLSFSDDDSDPIAEYEEFIVEFHAEQGNWRPLVEQELVRPDDPEVTATGLGLDRSYFDVARMFGGCPGQDAPRLTALDGLSYAFGQEVAANVLCERPELQEWMPPTTEAHSVMAALTARLLSRSPTPEELAAVDTHACGGDACDDAELIQGLCVALLGSHEMLFY